MPKPNGCEICTDGLYLAMLNGDPTHLQTERMIEGLETQADLIGCGVNGVTCEPLKRLQKQKELIEKQIKS